MDLERVSALIVPLLERERDLVTAWVFGSTARGTARVASDVDVALLFESPIALTRLIGLQSDATGVLRTEVQLVDARVAPVDLLHRVFRDGMLLVDRDRGRRIAFEVETRNRYFDMRPILLEYRRVRGAT